MMSSADSLLSREECTAEVRLIARRTALLFSAFAETLLDEFGEEMAYRLISKAIWGYGQSCGSAVLAEVERLGLPVSQENFDKARDLPHLGWEGDSLTTAEGEVHPIVTFCPLAETFMSLGPRAQRYGRLYCNVDQAKQQAYNPAVECVHVRNVLDGDPFCEFQYRPVKPSG
jgi:hypothetical protein